LANKYEDIVNLQRRRHIVAAARLQLVIKETTYLLTWLDFAGDPGHVTLGLKLGLQLPW